MSRQGWKVVVVEVIVVTFERISTLSSVEEAVQKNQSVLVSGSQGTCLWSLKESQRRRNFFFPFSFLERNSRTT